MGVNERNLDQLRIDRETEVRGGGRTWIILLACLLLAAIGGGGWWFGKKPVVEVRTTVAQEMSAARPYTVLNASGYVTARRKATVSSKVTGKIVTVSVEEGVRVEEGEVLAQLDVSNVAANLKLAEAQLDVAKSALSETEVRLEEAILQLRRVSTLTRESISTQSALDTAQADVDSLQARLTRQNEEITVAEEQIFLWKQELEDRTVRAPFAGVVVSKDAQPGEMISPVSAGGGFTRTGICTLVDMSSLEIEVDVSERYIHNVDPGQKVEATLDAYTDWKIPGRVIAIIPTADRQKATVKVRIGFDKLDPRILPDMGVKVAFLNRTEDADLLAGRKSVFIPTAGTRRENDQDVVFILEDGHVKRRVVTLGPQVDATVAVLAGVSAGERVVVNLPANLEDGAAAVEKGP